MDFKEREAAFVPEVSPVSQSSHALKRRIAQETPNHLDMETEEVKNKLAEILPKDEKGNFQLFLGERVGHLELDIKDSEIVLDNIYVRPENRGKGSGDFLLSILKGVSEMSRYMITGVVEANGRGENGKSNEELWAWYLSRGFKKDKGNKIIYLPKSLYSAT